MPDSVLDGKMVIVVPARVAQQQTWSESAISAIYGDKECLKRMSTAAEPDNAVVGWKSIT